MTEEDRLAVTIRGYWQSRGYHVYADVETCRATSPRNQVKYTYAAVRSDLVAGLPRDIRPELPTDVAIRRGR